MVKYMLYPNIADLINLNMSWMKAAVSCAFKHSESPQKDIQAKKAMEIKIDDPNETGSNLMQI